MTQEVVLTASRLGRAARRPSVSGATARGRGRAGVRSSRSDSKARVCGSRLSTEPPDRGPDDTGGGACPDLPGYSPTDSPHRDTRDTRRAHAQSVIGHRTVVLRHLQQDARDTATVTSQPGQAAELDRERETAGKRHMRTAHTRCSHMRHAHI